VNSGREDRIRRARAPLGRNNVEDPAVPTAGLSAAATGLRGRAAQPRVPGPASNAGAARRADHVCHRTLPARFMQTCVC
jgi:hypothetical protein